MVKHTTIKNFIIGNAVFVPDNENKLMEESLLKGTIHYNFSNEKYKTIESQEILEERINKICILFADKNKFAVGLEYIYRESAAPVLIIKTSGVKWITQICKDSGINIIYDTIITKYIFYHTEEHSEISPDIWEYVVEIFAKLIKDKDTAFLKRIKYKE
jgi:type III secretion system FlhB-like substrate exporter